MTIFGQEMLKLYKEYKENQINKLHEDFIKTMKDIQKEVNND